MGRKRLSRQLELWMNGEHVGFWRVTASGRHELGYSESWLASPLARPISLSLPLQAPDDVHRGSVVEFYFENLLPDDPGIRGRIQRRFSVRSTRAFDLLTEIGRDCVGALQLVPGDADPQIVNVITGDEICEAEIAALLRDVRDPEFSDDRRREAFRISIAGAQEKTALLFHQGRWFIPRGTTPTTHILKLPLGEVGRRRIDLSDSVANEWLCARILKAYGQEVAESSILQFEDQNVLAVERFDRGLSQDASWIIRHVQEDLCQVFGVSPEAKYESEGGPGIVRIMDVLRGSADAGRDRRSFFRSQILFWLLCAIDGHAKNFSIRIGPRGTFSSTPLYDVVSAWPVIGRGARKLALQEVHMAMSVKGKSRHYRWDHIHRRHWQSTARLCGFDAEIDFVIDDIVEQTPAVLDLVHSEIPASFPAHIAHPILGGIRKAAKRLS
ncbi:MAG: type II toxin-antitoxin system HipA family toxin [Bacteroidetes bacterium]|nr:type II toxin-antitoxin system HipA family toxin [Bacteroidota bacterium]